MSTIRGLVKSVLSTEWGCRVKIAVRKLGTWYRPNQNHCPFSWMHFMGVVRSTYLIDEKGIIVKAFGGVKAAENPQQMLDAITV